MNARIIIILKTVQILSVYVVLKMGQIHIFPLLLSHKNSPVHWVKSSRQQFM